MNKKGIYKESGKILFGNKTRKHLVKQNRKAQIKKKNLKLFLKIFVAKTG